MDGSKAKLMDAEPGEDLESILNDIQAKSGKQLQAIKKIVSEELQVNIATTGVSPEHQSTKMRDIIEYLNDVDNSSICHPLENVDINIIQQDLTKLHLNNANERRDMEKTIKDLKEQKSMLDAVVKRQQAIIDQNVEQRVGLNKQFEILLNELETRKYKHENNIKALECKHRNEITMLRDQLAAAKRASSKADNMAASKRVNAIEMVKTELELITERHADTERALREQLENDIKLLKKQHAENLNLQLERFKAKMLEEKEAALYAQKQEFKKTLIEERESFATSLEKHKARYENECERKLEEQKARDCKERNAELTRIKEAHENEIINFKESMKNTLKLTKLDMQQKYHNYRITTDKKMQEMLQQKELEIRSKAIEDRDRDIEKIVEEFQKQLTVSNADNERKIENHNNELRKITEEYELRLKQASELRQSALNNISELQDEIRILHKQLQDEVRNYNSLLSEKHRIHETIANQEQRLEDQRIDHVRQMQVLSERVKQTIDRKDEQIVKLVDEINTLKALIDVQIKIKDKEKS